MTDLDDVTLAKLAREMVMNIRNYQAVFTDFGISEEDYYEIEKNDFYKRVKEQFAQEWNSSLSTKDRLRIGSLAYLEQLLPAITRRALRAEESLAASTEVGKLLEKIGSVGEQKGEKPAGERFVININLGADVERFDEAIEVGTEEVPKLEKTHGKTHRKRKTFPAIERLRTAGEGQGSGGQGGGELPDS